jgi:hypothetical protein
MRKMMTAALLGLFVVLTTAAPAFALRDPFDPVISQAELTGSGDTSGAGDGTGATGDGTGTDGAAGDDVVAGNSSEGLANTGADTEPWLVAAYALIAIGAGAVAFSKVNADTA